MGRSATVGQEGKSGRLSDLSRLAHVRRSTVPQYSRACGSSTEAEVTLGGVASLPRSHAFAAAFTGPFSVGDLSRFGERPSPDTPGAVPEQAVTQPARSVFTVGGSCKPSPPGSRPGTATRRWRKARGISRTRPTLRKAPFVSALPTVRGSRTRRLVGAPSAHATLQARGGLALAFAAPVVGRTKPVDARGQRGTWGAMGEGRWWVRAPRQCRRSAPPGAPQRAVVRPRPGDSCAAPAWAPALGARRRITPSAGGTTERTRRE